MDVLYTLICALLVVSLSLRPSAKPLTALQDQGTTPDWSGNLTVTDVTPRANLSRADQDPDVVTREKIPPPAKRKHTNKQTSKQTNRQTNKREKRKNCFGFKMDRISDLSGMGCKKD